MNIHTNTWVFYYAIRHQNKIEILKTLQKINLEETYGEDGDTVVRLLLQTEDFAEKEVLELLDALYHRDPNIGNKIKEAVRVLTKKLECASNKSDENNLNSIARSLIEHEKEKFYDALRFHSFDAFSRNPDENIMQIENESVSFLEWLISKGLDFKNAEGKDPLQLSIEYNLQHISCVLLKHTQNVNRYIQQHNQSLLHTFFEKKVEYRDKYQGSIFRERQHVSYASRYSSGSVKLLLEKGASAVAYDCWDRTPLYMVFKERENTDIIEMMIDDLLVKNESPTTTFVELLKCCVWWDENRIQYFMNVLRELVNRGVDVDAKDVNGTTPVHWAFRGKNWGAVAFLSDYGADFGVLTKIDENLFHALAKKIDLSVEVDHSTQERLFDLLLRKGCCDINAKTKTDEETPLHVASESGNLVVVRNLIEHGAVVDCKNMSGETPLHLAVHGDSPRVAEVLLKNGAEVNSKDICGRWPLFHAVDNERDRHPLVPVLLRSGAYVNAEVAGESSFSRAVRRFGVHNAREMLAYGADINDDRVLSLLFSTDKRCAELQTLLMEHWVKLYAAKLEASKKHAAIVKSKIPQIFYNECLKEVARMKKIRINKSTSIYDFLQLDFGRRRVLINDEKLKTIVDSLTVGQRFSKYAVIIQASYREAVLWKSLLEPAKRGWLKLTGVRLPGECLEPIFAHLRNADLLGMIEYDEDL